MMQNWVRSLGVSCHALGIRRVLSIGVILNRGCNVKMARIEEADRGRSGLEVCVGQHSGFELEV